MTVEWNNRDYRFSSNGGNGEESFGEHDERMKLFCRSHANVMMVNAPRCDESALLERMRLLRVNHTILETGGSRFFNGTTDWSIFVPVLRVARYKLSSN